MLKSPKETINNFPNLLKFCKSDLNEFFSLLRKGIYSYRYMVAGKNLMKLQKKLFTAN